jgi:hypothetical protein
MGGRGSGRTDSWRTKPVAESYQRLEIHQFKGQGVKLREGMAFTAIWEYKTPQGEAERVSQHIFYEWTPCHYGGKRPWFVCPCGRRAAVLYLMGRHLRCRVCGGLTYASCNESPFDRAIRREQKVRMRLGGEPNSSLPFPPRPKFMRHTTYFRLFLAHQQAWKVMGG